MSENFPEILKNILSFLFKIEKQVHNFFLKPFHFYFELMGEWYYHDPKPTPRA